MTVGMRTSFVTRLTDVNSVDKEGVGTLRWEGNKCYKYVKFLNTSATVAGAAGKLLCYTSEDGYDDNEVCMDMTDADSKPVGAGICLSAVTGTLTVAYYIWMQIKGMSTTADAIAASVDGTPVAAGDGDPLVAGAGDHNPTVRHILLIEIRNPNRNRIKIRLRLGLR